MNEELDQLATQGDGAGGEGAASDGSQGAGSGAAGAPDTNEPFLKVNDRVAYKTREEAARAFDEAGKRISTLAPYEKALKEFYGDAYSPELLRAHLSELVEKRKAEKAAKDAEAQKAAANDPELEGKTPEQQQEIKRAREWFKKEADRLGYVSKDALKKLEDKLAEIENGPRQAVEQSQQEAASVGEQELRKQLGASSVALNDIEFGRLASRIKAYIDGDDDLVAAWQKAVQRGDTSKTTELIMEAARFALPLVKAGAKFVDPVSAKIAAGQNRQRLQQQAPRKLPQQGVAGRDANVQREKFSGIGDKKLTDRALAYMEEHMADAS